MTAGAYQTHILGENLLVIVTTITVHTIALAKAHYGGKMRTIAL